MMKYCHSIKIYPGSSHWMIMTKEFFIIFYWMEPVMSGLNKQTANELYLNLATVDKICILI